MRKEIKLKELRKNAKEKIKEIGHNLKDDFNRLINLSIKDMVTITVKQLFRRMEMV